MKTVAAMTMKMTTVMNPEMNTLRLSDLDLHERLPAGTYNLNYDELRSEYYLETINDFQLKGKIYGTNTLLPSICFTI